MKNYETKLRERLEWYESMKAKDTSTSYDGTNGISHKWDKVETGQYLYHLTYKENRESIAKNGLNKYNSIFAHNTNVFTMDWYWVCLDKYEWCRFYYREYVGHLLSARAELLFFVNQRYDIWRIDNHIAKKEWCVDYIGWGGERFENSLLDLYVKCKGVIPANAITLCTLDLEAEDYIEIEGEALCKTYLNNIIPRADYIVKYGQEPDYYPLVEKLRLANLLELDDNDETAKCDDWKKIKRNIRIGQAA